MGQAQNSQPRVLLVDDDADLLRLMTIRLEANGYEVCAVESGEEARARLATYRPNLVVTDMQMGGMDGMQLFAEVQDRYLGIPVIILTAHGTIPDAVEATQKGVFSYLAKPIDAAVFLQSVSRAIQQSGEPVESKGDEPVGDQSWRTQIICRSAKMERLLQEAGAAARSSASILIQSQTGTGKELLARAIHKASDRHEASFMALNCAAMPEPLLESELFGHVQGAFTGATRSHQGLFQAAAGGTVFLDEIGDMPLAAQAKLLRVLEEKQVRPVGATQSLPIDVRIISATHHNLQKKVEDGQFREDLYYRLNVISLELPRLADRREDIPLLCQHFCEMVARKENTPAPKFAPEAMEMLAGAAWPGNVRQLLNVVEQCVVLSTGPLISVGLVERALRVKPDKLLSLSEARDQFEHDYLIQLLQLTEGNVTLAARLADRNRSEFYNLMRKQGLDPSLFRND